MPHLVRQHKSPVYRGRYDQEWLLEPDSLLDHLGVRLEHGDLLDHSIQQFMLLLAPKQLAKQNIALPILA